MSRRAAGLLLCLAACTASCAGDAGARTARWRPLAAVKGVVDLTAEQSISRGSHFDRHFQATRGR
jgi:hypothetical protein